MPTLEIAGKKLASTQRHPRRAGFFGPAETARALRVTVSGLEYLIRKGALSYEKDASGVRWFDPSEVRALAAARGIEAPYSGQVCRRVFELFDEGRSLPHIVKELSILPEQVRKLWIEYRTPLGRDVRSTLRLTGREERRRDAEHAAALAELDERLARAAGVAEEKT